MKNLLFLLCVCGAGTVLNAAPVTNAPVTRPTTNAAVSRPVTSVSVSHPVTSSAVTRPASNAAVTRPTTNAVVLRPVTNVSVTHPGEKALSVATPGFSGAAKPAPAAPSAPPASSSGGSYTPSYKQAKDLKSAQIPKAASLGAGGGLGITDPNAAQKAKEAEEFEVKKAESTQVSIDDVLKKTNIPSDMASKLKQRNFEAAKSAGKK